MHPVSIQCPYCGETIELMVDLSIEHQEYSENCEVCCRPMVVTITSGKNGPHVEARTEEM